ncbi:hypothetical protein [Paenibacillus dendritiformis]|uniref:Uncharacterized protein n=1 Tax=Paenibacillus dendritiformis C454 TaxID=1131935 RepID=H3SG61_9BACL|nr:hypothetical protein [Paenibacillus dendritiformis]EHQ61871.1 hypothetical protein PDENDC454_12580 [Paenibacillus dendritiformis C454]CAH8767607.1 serine protease [Paenibacillus dendritiformis]
MNRYFKLAEDGRIEGRAIPVGLSNSLFQLSENGKTEGDSTSLSFPIREQEHVEYVDFLERPLPLVSDKFKQLLEKYMPDMRWNLVILTDVRRVHQEVYWNASPPRTRCLSVRSEYFKDGALKRLVLEGNKTYEPFFQVDGVRETIWIVNLAVAESMLRRDFYGICLEEVERD